MATGRMLKKNISDSRRLSELKTDSARMLWTWIIPFLDVEGRFYAAPDMIKGKVVPRLKSFTEENISEYLQDMADVGLIQLYEADGDQYLQFRKFNEHQMNLRKDREAPSSIPEPIQTTPIKRKSLKTDVWELLWEAFNKGDHICPICHKKGEKRKDRDNEYVIDGYIPFEIDHIQPLSKGGSDEIENLQVICRTCNRSKNNKTQPPEQLQSNSRATPVELPPNIREVNLKEAKGTPEELPPVDNSTPIEEPQKDALKENQKIELRELYQKVQEYYPDFHLQQFYQTFHKKHPEAMNHTLKTLVTNAAKGNKIRNPWEWCEKIILNESQNYTAADHQKIAEELKKPGMCSFADIMKGIQLHTAQA